jgi:hypothetical protein
MLVVSAAVIGFGTVSGLDIGIELRLTIDVLQWTVVSSIGRHEHDNDWSGIGCVPPINKDQCVLLDSRLNCQLYLTTLPSAKRMFTFGLWSTS